MQSAVKFFFFKPDMDVNKEMEDYLQKVSGWEVVSVSHQMFQGIGTSVAIVFKATGKTGMNISKLETPAFINQP